MAEHEEQTVLAWYDASRSIFIDLVGDYAGKELFLVEGDSLLRECFSDERLDFTGMNTSQFISTIAVFYVILSRVTLSCMANRK